jgi:branched-chain amino acid aminotransferase
MKVYITGKLVDKADAKISVFDHGLLYGDGVFEGIRCYRGKVFRLSEHLDRLYDGALHIRLEIPLTKEQFGEAIVQTLRANELKDAYIRAIVTRGSGTLGLDPRKCSNPEVIIITDSIQLYPREAYEKGLEVATVATIRNHPGALDPRIKSLNYLNNILARMEATLAGCEEALMLNHKGEIAECSGDNIFLVKQGVLKTPPPEAGILRGITRQAVLDLAKAAGIPTLEAPLTRHDVYSADECFLTGTAAEVIAVSKVDGRTIGTGRQGPITKQLHERFHALTRE